MTAAEADDMLTRPPPGAEGADLVDCPSMALVVERLRYRLLRRPSVWSTTEAAWARFLRVVRP